MNEVWDEDTEDQEEIEHTQPTRRTRGSGDARGNLYLLTGVLVGVVLGLVYAWVISPVKYTDVAPESLSINARDQYRKMIALAYSADRNLPRASERLKLIDSGDLQQALASQAQRMISAKQSAQEARTLAVLAADLGNPPTQPAALPQPGVSATAPAVTPLATEGGAVAAVQTPTLPRPTPTATFTPAATFTPRPTATQMQILDAPFTLKSKQEVCDGSIPAGEIQFQVNDSSGAPLPGVKIVVTWQDGEDTFYTGLIPEVNPGYADYEMKLNTTYSVKVGDVSDAVGDLKIGQCGGGMDPNLRRRIEWSVKKNNWRLKKIP